VGGGKLLCYFVFFLNYLFMGWFCWCWGGLGGGGLGGGGGGGGREVEEYPAMYH